MEEFDDGPNDGSTISTVEGVDMNVLDNDNLDHGEEKESSVPLVTVMGSPDDVQAEVEEDEENENGGHDEHSTSQTTISEFNVSKGSISSKTNTTKEEDEKDVEMECYDDETMDKEDLEVKQDEEMDSTTSTKDAPPQCQLNQQGLNHLHKDSTTQSNDHDESITVLLSAETPETLTSDLPQMELDPELNGTLDQQVMKQTLSSQSSSESNRPGLQPTDPLQELMTGNDNGATGIDETSPVLKRHGLRTTESLDHVTKSTTSTSDSVKENVKKEENNEKGEMGESLSLNKDSQSLKLPLEESASEMTTTISQYAQDENVNSMDGMGFTEDTNETAQLDDPLATNTGSSSSNKKSITMEESGLFHSCQSHEHEAEMVEAASEGIGFTEDSKDHTTLDNMTSMTLNPNDPTNRKLFEEEEEEEDVSISHGHGVGFTEESNDGIRDESNDGMKSENLLHGVTTRVNEAQDAEAIRSSKEQDKRESSTPKPSSQDSITGYPSDEKANNGVGVLSLTCPSIWDGDTQSPPLQFLRAHDDLTGKKTDTTTDSAKKPISSQDCAGTKQDTMAPPPHQSEQPNISPNVLVDNDGNNEKKSTSDSNPAAMISTSTPDVKSQTEEHRIGQFQYTNDSYYAGRTESIPVEYSTNPSPHPKKPSSNSIPTSTQSTPNSKSQKGGASVGRFDYTNDSYYNAGRTESLPIGDFSSSLSTTFPTSPSKSTDGPTIEQVSNKQENAVKVIQNAYRCFVCKKRFQSIRKATVVIQRSYSCHRFRVHVKRTIVQLKASAILIQSLYRGFKSRKCKKPQSTNVSLFDRVINKSTSAEEEKDTSMDTMNQEYVNKSDADQTNHLPKGRSLLSYTTAQNSNLSYPLDYLEHDQEAAKQEDDTSSKKGMEIAVDDETTQQSAAYSLTMTPHSEILMDPHEQTTHRFSNQEEEELDKQMGCSLTMTPHSENLLEPRKPYHSKAPMIFQAPVIAKRDEKKKDTMSTRKNSAKGSSSYQNIVTPNITTLKQSANHQRLTSKLALSSADNVNEKNGPVSVQDETTKTTSTTRKLGKSSAKNDQQNTSTLQKQPQQRLKSNVVVELSQEEDTFPTVEKKGMSEEPESIHLKSSHAPTSEESIIDTQPDEDDDKSKGNSNFNRLKRGYLPPEKQGDDDTEMGQDVDTDVLSQPTKDIRLQLQKLSEINVAQITECLLPATDVSKMRSELEELKRQNTSLISENKKIRKDRDTLKKKVTILSTKIEEKTALCSDMERQISRIQPILVAVQKLGSSSEVAVSPPKNAVTPSKRAYRIIDDSGSEDEAFDDNTLLSNLSPRKKTSDKFKTPTRDVANKKDSRIITQSSQHKDKSDSSDSDSRPVTFKQLWRFLQERGWKFKTGPEPHGMVYVPPNGSVRIGSVLGEDFYLADETLWQKGKELGFFQLDDLRTPPPLRKVLPKKISKTTRISNSAEHEVKGRKKSIPIIMKDSKKSENGYVKKTEIKSKPISSSFDFKDNGDELEFDVNKVQAEREDAESVIEKMDNTKLCGRTGVFTERTLHKLAMNINRYLQFGEDAVFMRDLFVPLWHIAHKEQDTDVDGIGWSYEKSVSAGSLGRDYWFVPPRSAGCKQGKINKDYFTSEEAVTAFMIQEVKHFEACTSNFKTDDLNKLLRNMEEDISMDELSSSSSKKRRPRKRSRLEISRAEGVKSPSSESKKSKKKKRRKSTPRSPVKDAQKQMKEVPAPVENVQEVNTSNSDKVVCTKINSSISSLKKDSNMDSDEVDPPEQQFTHSQMEGAEILLGLNSSMQETPSIQETPSTSFHTKEKEVSKSMKEPIYQVPITADAPYLSSKQQVPTDQTCEQAEEETQQQSNQTTTREVFTKVKNNTVSKSAIATAKGIEALLKLRARNDKTSQSKKRPLCPTPIQKQPSSKKIKIATPPKLSSKIKSPSKSIKWTQSKSPSKSPSKSKVDFHPVHLTQEISPGIHRFNNIMSPSSLKTNDGVDLPLIGLSFFLSGMASTVAETIVSLGGKVLGEVTGENLKPRHVQRRLFFISQPERRRTHKYLLASALGVPMLHFRWVFELKKRWSEFISNGGKTGIITKGPSPFDSKLYGSHRLPLGFSTESGLYELQRASNAKRWSRPSCDEKGTALFDGLKVVLALESIDMGKKW